MEYLQSAISLLSLLKQTNSTFLEEKHKPVDKINKMYVRVDEQSLQEIVMESFTNDYVLSTIKNIESSEAFVITDLATMDIKGKELTYFLYKGYHSKLDKGMVFYQAIDKETHEPLGTLQFSNMEENPFYAVKTPDTEESSCNAMETDKVVKNGKSIVFIIGHMDEERLVYDIQRLIFDTVNNVSKHDKLRFSFIIHIARYGGSPSDELRTKVKEIELFTNKYIVPEYPNTGFTFDYESDASLN